MLDFSWNRAILIGLAFVIGVLAIANIQVDVPPNLRGELTAQGTIVHCDFRRLGRASNRFFLGIILDGGGSPYLRLNPNWSERDRYESLCKRKPHVSVTYHAVKHLVGPIRFWASNVAEG